MTEAGSTRMVRTSLQIAASAERVLAAFLTVSDLKRWWGAAQGLIEARKGGLWTLAWADEAGGYKYAVSGVVKSLLPGKRLRIEPLVYLNAERSILGPMRLSLSLREKEGRTRISVRQDGYGEGPEWDWYYEATGPAWKESLRSLKAFLEEGAG
jgi:uncharacterized protein YndB with AHSA1/START domain